MPRGPVRSLHVELGTTDYKCREENNNVIHAVTFFFVGDECTKIGVRGFVR